MASAHHLYGEIENRSDLHEVFATIRDEVGAADTRSRLTELYRRAGYLITLSYAPSWKARFGPDARKLRHISLEEFRKTARRINYQAEQIGLDPDYDEDWGD